MNFSILPTQVRHLLEECYISYKKAIVANGHSETLADDHFHTLTALIADQIKKPHKFEIIHNKVTKSFDYYRFGLNFISPLIQKLVLTGQDHLVEIEKKVKANENVILFANHQIEADPQIICYALEEKFQHLAEHLRFVAGHRVTTDPFSIPFSLGCNLLCIYSKKYIDYPPELKTEKIKHNQSAIKNLGKLLSKGGQVIYVAPSGGRDRKNSTGKITLSPFDSQSIEMFHFMATRAKVPTHFYPLALATYEITPPPGEIATEIGEKRICYPTPVALSFGEKLYFKVSTKNKHLQRVERCQIAFDAVDTLYKKITL